MASNIFARYTKNPFGSFEEEEEDNVQEEQGVKFDFFRGKTYLPEPDTPKPEEEPVQFQPVKPLPMPKPLPEPQRQADPVQSFLQNVDESVVSRNQMMPEQPQTPEENTIKKIAGNFIVGPVLTAKGLINDLSRLPYESLYGIKKFSDYMTRKFVEDNPHAATAIIQARASSGEPPEQLQQNSERIRAYLKSIGEATKDLEYDLTPEEQQSLFTQLGQGLGSTVSGFLPGVTAMRTWGQSFDQAKNQGLSNDEAGRYAGTQALLQEASERIGSAALGKLIKGGGGLVKSAVKGFASEGTQELGQETLSIIAEKVYGIKSDSPEWKRLLTAFGIGGVVGGGLAGAGSQVARARNRYMDRLNNEIIDAAIDGDEKVVWEKQKEKARLESEAIKEQEQWQKEEEERFRKLAELEEQDLATQQQETVSKMEISESANDTDVVTSEEQSPETLPESEKFEPESRDPVQDSNLFTDARKMVQDQSMQQDEMMQPEPTTDESSVVQPEEKGVNAFAQIQEKIDEQRENIKQSKEKRAKLKEKFALEDQREAEKLAKQQQKENQAILDQSDIKKIVRKHIKKPVYIPPENWSDTADFRRNFIGKFTKTKKPNSIEIDTLAQEIGSQNPGIGIETWQDLVNKVDVQSETKVPDYENDPEYIEHITKTTEIDEALKDDPAFLDSDEGIIQFQEYLRQAHKIEAGKEEILYEVNEWKTKSAYSRTEETGGQDSRDNQDQAQVLTSPTAEDIEASQANIRQKKAIKKKNAELDRKYSKPGYEEKGRLFSEWETTAPGKQPSLDFSVKETSSGINDYLDTDIPVGLSVKDISKKKKKTPFVMPEESGLASVNLEVEKRKQAAKGLGKLPLFERIKKTGTAIKQQARPFRHLDHKAHPVEADIFRRFKEVPENSRYTAYEVVKGIVGPIADPKKYRVFSENIILPDLIQDIEAGMFTETDPKTGEVKSRELPFGYTSLEEVNQDLEKYQAIAEKNPDIKEALAKRKKFNDSLRNELVALDLLPKEVLDKPEYFHHQVLAHRAMKEFQGTGTSSSDVRLHKKGWQHSRKGSSQDYNTDYLESEFEVISQALSQIDTHRVMQEIDDTSNISDTLKHRIREMNLDRVYGGREVRDRVGALKASLRFGDLNKEAKQKIKDELSEIDVLAPSNRKIAIAIDNMKKVHAGPKRGPAMLEPGEDEGRASGVNPVALAQELMESGNPEAISAATMFYNATQERESFIRESLGKEYRTWGFQGSQIDTREIPEGYVEWQPKKGHVFYEATTITDKALDRLMEEGGFLDESEVKKVMALGGKRKTWILPEDVAKTMEEFRHFKDDGFIKKYNKKIMRGWKVWTLMNPFRVIRYNLNNMSGDLDAVFAYNPVILKYTSQASKELWAEYRGKSQSQDMREARENGLISSGLTIQEIPDIANQKVLDEILGRKPIRSLPKKYWEGTKELTQLRENILRLAAYKHFKSEIYKGKKNIYAASDRKAIDAIKDKNEKSAKLARELLGDYGNISEFGQWMRENLTPFYSWMEVNAVRYARLIKNMPHEGGSAKGKGARMAGVMAWKGTKLGAKMFALYALVNLWNHIKFPDELEELSDYQRRQQHLILGKTEDGEIRTIRIQGALSDLLSWASLEDFPQDIKDLATGEATLADKGKEIAKAPFKKLFLASVPVYRTTFELLTKKSLYPDPEKPRPIRDRAEHASRFVSLEKIYKWAAGKPTRGLGKEIAGLLVYQSDPGESAYWGIRQDMYKWMEKQEGYDRPDIGPTRKQNYLYYYKQALRYGDAKAAEKYHDLYMKEGGTERGMKSSITKTHPLAPIKKKDRERYMRTLSKQDRKIYDRALGWYKKVYQK